ncbi:unnamed protein product [Ixodes persulcatus]
MNPGGITGTPLSAGAQASCLPSFLTGAAGSGHTPWPATPERSSMLTSATPASRPLRTYGSSDESPRSRILSPMDRTGPPARGLFSSPQISTTEDEWSRVPGGQSTTSILQESSVLNRSGSFRQSPSQVDPFFSQGEKLTSSTELDETWVTVFGFPPSATSYIVQQFSHYGNILEHRAVPESNWVHLHYQSKLQAKKALSKNGKVFGTNTMVGVKPCLEAMQPSPSTKFTPAKENGGMRSLCRAYRASSASREVGLATEHLPQRDNTVVSRALEYVFGW